MPCRCDALTRPGLVLDPFFGTGTVGAVAQELGRDWLGMEISETFAAIARERLGLEPTAYLRKAPGLAVAA